MNARDKELIHKANEELLKKRKELGIRSGKLEPISKSISLTFDATDEEKAYFQVLQIDELPTDHPRIDVTSRDKWESFNSDRHPDLQKAVKMIGEWYTERTDEGHAIILSGGFGVGKSHLAEAVHNLYGYGAKWWNEVDLCEALQGTYGHYSRRTEQEIFAEAWNARLLILDGLGEYDTKNIAWMQNIYHKLFTGRLEANKGFMITTNLDCKAPPGQVSEFQDWVGNKNFSRIFGAVDDPRFYVDLFSVPDFRLRNFK